MLFRSCDTNALFHRSRNALLRGAGELTTTWGQPVTGSYGVLNSLFSILEKNHYDSILPVFDAGGNWRKREDKEYKANRGPADLSFKADFDLLLKELLFYLGFNPVGLEGYEADDVIASVAKASVAFSKVEILTCDRDLLSCVTPRVSVILFNSAKKVELVDPEGVEQIYGVKPELVPTLKAIAGDPSDNIAGLKGIGNKTAAKIINECEPHDGMTVADLVCLHPKVRDNAGTFLANLRLTTIKDDIDVKWFANTAPTEEVVRAILEQ